MRILALITFYIAFVSPARSILVEKRVLLTQRIDDENKGRTLLSSLLMLSDNLRNLFKGRKLFRRIFWSCAKETFEPTPLVVTPNPTPGPTTSPPTSTLWDQVGSDINGQANEETGEVVQLDETGKLMVVAGDTTLRMYASGVNNYNVRAWVIKQDLSSSINGDGISVSLGNDAQALVMGDPNDGFGKASVFNVDDGGVWSLRVTFGGINSGDLFGHSVCIRDDGDRIVVGAPGGDYGKLFDLLGEGIFWTLVLDGHTNGFGMSMSISQDGYTLAVGAYEDTNVVGSVYIYELEDFYVLQRFDGNDRTTNGGYSYGHSVSLNSDGTVLAIGSLEEDVVNIFRYNPSRSQFDEIGPEIIGVAGSNFGESVSLSSSGDSVVVGAPLHTNEDTSEETGRAFAYGLGLDSWNFIGGFNGEATDDAFGSSVSISGDGKRVAIGGIKNAAGGTDAGHVRVYSMV